MPFLTKLTQQGHLQHSKSQSHRRQACKTSKIELSAFIRITDCAALCLCSSSLSRTSLKSLLFQLVDVRTVNERVMMPYTSKVHAVLFIWPIDDK